METPQAQPMMRNDLAKRLGLTPSYLGQKRQMKEFTRWSRERDPDSIGWKFDARTKLFYPVSN